MTNKEISNELKKIKKYQDRVNKTGKEKHKRVKELQCICPHDEGKIVKSPDGLISFQYCETCTLTLYNTDNEYNKATLKD